MRRLFSTTSAWWNSTGGAAGLLYRLIVPTRTTRPRSRNAPMAAPVR